MTTAESASGSTLLIRCDATAATGLGHLSRCLALADGFVAAGWRVCFVGRFDECGQKMLGERCRFALMAVSGSGADAEATQSLARRLAASAVLLDSYAIDAGYVEAVASGIPVWLFDDYGRLDSYPCRALINFTVAAARYAYPRETATALLGPAWFPVRAPLLRARRGAVSPGIRVRRLFIALGGYDRFNLAERILRSLRSGAKDCAIRITSPRDGRRKRRLQGMLGRFARGSQVLPPMNDLGKALRWCDACLSGGGLTKYEASFCARPVAVVSQSLAEAGETATFVKRHLCYELGCMRWRARREGRRLQHFLSDAVLRRRLAHGGRRLFVAQSTERTVRALMATLDCNEVRTI